METMTLYELNSLVRETLQYAMSGSYWVQAEISSLNVAGPGHCYLELVQKDEGGGGFVAKAKANIWRGTYSRIRPMFENVTGQRLSVGMKVLLEVVVQFHESFGYALVVQNIDPTYTMGDMARRRREIIMRLQNEGVVNLNKEVPMSMIPQRVAVVSSETAAGYGDFCNQLANNPYGFVFRTGLFPALMQGDGVEASVIAALDRINAEVGQWDVVVIIRGGGSVSELSCFDSYLLALNIANFPLPVITGIGHERDESVCDMVAHTRVKTPTAAAEFLIGRLLDSAERLESLARTMCDSVRRRMESESIRFQRLSQKLPGLFAVVRTRHESRLQNIDIRLASGWMKILQDNIHKLEMAGKSLELADPARILSRGYSMTTLNGHVVKGAQDVRPGDRLVTRFSDGAVTSVVE